MYYSYCIDDKDKEILLKDDFSFPESNDDVTYLMNI